jgi:hypothetical protein
MEVLKRTDTGVLALFGHHDGLCVSTTGVPKMNGHITSQTTAYYTHPPLQRFPPLQFLTSHIRSKCLGLDDTDIETAECMVFMATEQPAEKQSGALDCLCIAQKDIRLDNYANRARLRPTDSKRLKLLVTTTKSATCPFHHKAFVK